MSQAWAHLSGAHRSVELAAVGRRVCEQEWDLLLLLDPAAAAEAAIRHPHVTGTPRPAPAPHGRPTASELLDAVREFLTGQVMPATTGQLAFHARVAANVLGIVARELELGPIPRTPRSPTTSPQDSRSPTRSTSTPPRQNPDGRCSRSPGLAHAQGPTGRSTWYGSSASIGGGGRD